MSDRISQQGWVLTTSTPDEFRELIRTEIVRVGKGAQGRDPPARAVDAVSATAGSFFQAFRVNAPCTDLPPPDDPFALRARLPCKVAALSAGSAAWLATKST